MRNYQKYYYDLIMSTAPEDTAITHSTKIYDTFYNKNGKFSQAKFKGYMKAGIEIFNSILSDYTDEYSSSELETIKNELLKSDNILTLSAEEQEQIVQDTIKEIEQKQQVYQTSDDIKDTSLISLSCPSCGGTRFKTNASQNIFHCIGCNNTYSKEELIKGNMTHEQEKET